MKRFALLLISLTLLISGSLTAQHDTTVVQTFSFDDPSPEGWGAHYEGTFKFPSKNNSWEKILMIRTLKCDSATKADKYPCGEWDYITHTLVRDAKNDSSELFALGSFITPYGKRLDLGGEQGWTWVYDVTEYAPLLHDEVWIRSGNNQELLDMKFLFIEGTPVREALKVENIYPFGNYKYEKLALDSVLQAKKIILEKDAKEFMLRARISGHGHFGPRNCCEWDSKTHSYYINDWEHFRWNVWKDCGFNPIYPQGGTWPFDRAGWCPGTKVDEYDFELTPKVYPGDTIKFDYAIEMFKDNGEKGGDFHMSHQLFSFKEASFSNDVTLVSIKAPSDEDQYSRINPICDNPIIIVKNTGKNPLKSFIVEYGLLEGKKSKYQWNGSLDFLESEEVYLPTPNWKNLKKDQKFFVKLISPNNTEDEYPRNNYLETKASIPLIVPEEFVLFIHTNDKERAKENVCFITNIDGQVYFEKSDFKDDTEYKETLKLEPGCYEFRFLDNLEDGISLHWWNYRDNPNMVGKNGKIEIQTINGDVIYTFKHDFGQELLLNFFVGKLP
jgi:hypothetical protein